MFGVINSDGTKARGFGVSVPGCVVGANFDPNGGVRHGG